MLHLPSQQISQYFPLQFAGHQQKYSDELAAKQYPPLRQGDAFMSEKINLKKL